MYYQLERHGAPDGYLDHFTFDDAIEAVLAHPERRFRPGSEWGYSNISYQLLAEIVAPTSGMSFGAFLQREVFEPLAWAARTTISARVERSNARDPS